MKKIVTGVLALAMVMGTVLSVSASVLQVGNQGTLTKILEVPQGVTTPNHSFNFTFTPTGIIDDNGNPAATPLGQAISTVTISIANGDTRVPGTGAQEGFDLITKTGATVNLSTLAWTRAGVYTYNVKETEVVGDAYRDSKAEYEMKVYVENDNATTPDGVTYVVTHVEFFQTRDDAGVVMTSTKAEPKFTNRFIVKSMLDISKHVSGKFANTEQEFTFTPEFERPLDSEEVTSLGTIFGTDGNPTGDTVTVVFQANDTTGTATPASFQLKHGEKIRFDDGTDGTLPAGTTWTLKETGEAEYTPRVDIFDNSATSFQNNTGSLATDMTISKGQDGTSDLKLGDVKSIAAWTNTRTDITPTGILLNNLPFIMLILVAIGGFVGYIASKRRKAMN